MWFKSPKSSTFNTQVYPTGVAVLAMTHTTVTYTTIGVEGLEPYEMDQQKIWHPGNDDQPPNDIHDPSEKHIGYSLIVPTQPANNGFGFFSSSRNPLQAKSSSNAHVVEIKVFHRATLIQRLISLKDIFYRRNSDNVTALSLSPEEADEFAARFVHRRSGDTDLVSLDPSLLPRSSGESIHIVTVEAISHPSGLVACCHDNEDEMSQIAVQEYVTNSSDSHFEDKVVFPSWQEGMMRSDARKREESLLERPMEVQAIEYRIREEERQARQWVKGMNAPKKKKSKFRALGRLAKKSMKIFGSK